ncbi:MAG: hypothetical protein H6581_20790 [Bacteroidia bacterium]|nr:hypothetical protein [Bacteroidia bacterium]
MQSFPVVLELKTLTCHRQEEGPQGARPYLWNVFFRIDGEGLKITNEFRLEGKGIYHFSAGSHGNLSPDNVHDGQVVRIPAQVGRWETRITPFMLPYFEAEVSGVVVVLSVLMEQNNLTNKGAEAGHEFLNQFVEKAVNSALLGFDPRRVVIHDIENSVKVYFAEKVSKFAEGLDHEVGKAVAQAQNILQNLWSLIDKDSLIGYEMWDFTPEKFAQAQSDTVPLVHVWETREFGKWELKGEFRKLST